MSDDPDGPEWRARLARAITQIRVWEGGSQREPDVHPMSELAEDDKRWPSYPVSTLAWIGLLSAWEHLGLVADDMERALARTGPLRSQAPFTLTRSALMGASQAVWLLCEGDREVRVRRGLSVALEEHHQHAEFIKDYVTDERLHEDVSPDFYGRMQRTHEAIVGRKKRVAKEQGGGGVSTTRIMQEAAIHLTRQEADSWQLRALKYEWRMSSASAHARLWPFFVRETERRPLPDGSGEMRLMTSTFRECTSAIGAAVLMTNEAVRLWNIRSSRPNAGAAFGLTGTAAPTG